MKKVLFSFLLIFLVGNIYAQDKTDTPKRGEGMTTFLVRNGYSVNDVEEFKNLNKTKIGKNNSLILGEKYKLPAKKASAKLVRGDKGGVEPLLGKKYEEYTLKSNQLAGACFYLVSGHGGPDPGAVTKVDGKELHEDEYAYDIMLRLARNLLEEGATVEIIIQDKKDGIRDDMYLKGNKSETCRGKKIPLDKKERLKQRREEINALSKKSNAKYKRAIFIHLDSRAHHPVDVFFYYYSENAKQSKQLANTLLKTFDKKYKEKRPGRGYDGTATARNLDVLACTPPAVFIECGNLHHERDRKRYLQADNRQALANWLRDGIIEDFKN